jgi:hypothetical protein
MFKTYRSKFTTRAKRLTEDNLEEAAAIINHDSLASLRAFETEDAVCPRGSVDCLPYGAGDYVIQTSGYYYHPFSARVFEYLYEPIDGEESGLWKTYRLKNKVEAVLITKDNLDDVVLSLATRVKNDELFAKGLYSFIAGRVGDYFVKDRERRLKSNFYYLTTADTFEAAYELAEEGHA